MNPELKQRWIAALRDPVYGANVAPFLRTDAGYSPLGVLWDILPGGGTWSRRRDAPSYGVIAPDGFWISLLPLHAARQAGLSWPDVLQFEKQGAPLSVIADLIANGGG